MKTDEIKMGSRVVGCDKAGNPVAGTVLGLTTGEKPMVQVAPVFYHPTLVPAENLSPAPTEEDVKHRCEATKPKPVEQEQTAANPGSASPVSQAQSPTPAAAPTAETEQSTTPTAPIATS